VIVMPTVAKRAHLRTSFDHMVNQYRQFNVMPLERRGGARYSPKPVAKLLSEAKGVRNDRSQPPVECAVTTRWRRG
jgi:hypothetical protein